MALSRNLLVAAAAIAPSLGIGGIGGPDAPSRATERSGAPPAALARVAFEENRGQAPASVRFVGRGRGVVALVDDRGADLLLGRGARAERARLVIGGGAPSRPAAVGAPLPGPAHYLTGNDSSKWVRGVPRFRALRAAAVAPGADLAWRGSDDGRIAFDLHLAPGIDPASVPISIAGARALAVDGEGRLVASLARGNLVLGRPRLWQESAQGRVPVEGRFALRGAGAVVTAGAFDRSLPLVVDPTLEYGSYLGGAGDDAGFSARTDANGVLCVAGTSTGSFQTVNPYDSTVSGSWDTVVAKVSADGADLLYATYLGGSGTDTPRDLAVAVDGFLVVVGETTSSNFPVASAIQGTGVIGSGMPPVPEGFASRLSIDGSLLEWSTYLGGTGSLDVAYGVAIDASGNAYVVGEAGSASFPTGSAIQGVKDAGTDAFVMRISSTGALGWSTFLGGDGDEGARGVSLDASGSLLVCGTTASTDFPTQDPYQGVKASGADAFVLRMPASGASLTWSTYFGANGTDVARSVVEGRNGSTWLGGDTTSTDFPVVVTAPQPNNNGARDAFVARLGPDGATFQFGTLLGGGMNDTAARIALDSVGAVCVAGTTDSSDFPVVSPLQGTFGGGSSDFFFARLFPTGTPLLCSTFLGGAGADSCEGFAFATEGSLWLAGTSLSADFPTAQAMDTVRSGNSDIALARIRMNLPNAPTNARIELGNPGSVFVKWNDSTAGLCPFEVERKDSFGAPFVPRATLQPGFLQFEDTTAPTGATVTWRVRAVDHGGPSAWAMTPATAIPPLPPESPSGTTATALDATTVRVTWTDNSAREDTVVVLRREAGGQPTAVLTVLENVVTADAPAKPQRTYFWSVRAENEGGASAVSNEVGAATPASFGWLLKRGSLKYLLDPGLDALLIKASVGTAAGGPNPVLDPRANGFELYLGSRALPPVISIPANDPLWKVGRTTFSWRSPRGVFPKVKMVYNSARGTLLASISKTDLPPTSLAGIFVGVDMGPMQAAGGTMPWTPKRVTGQSKFP